MAAAIVRLRAAAAVGGRRQFASSAVGLMLPSSKMYSLGDKKVVNMNSSNNIEKEFESDWVVGSSHGWVGLTKFEKDRVRCGSSSGVSLWNPMNGSRMMLPPVHTIRSHPSCRVVKRVMVDDSECSRAIAVGFTQWLGVCWPGRCSEWTRFGFGRRYEDVVVACSQSRVYTVDRDWEVERWNVSEPRRPRREWKKDMNKSEKKFPRKPDLLSGYKLLHLVYAEHSGQLFLLTRHYVAGMELNERDTWNAGMFPMKTLAFDVHLLLENENENKNENNENCQVRYMEHSLDGLVMFVGINNSLAVPAADFPHLKPDSIYFTDHPRNIPDIRSVDRICGGHDVGIYDYKNRTISSCYYPGHHQALKRIHPPPFWLTG